MDATTSLVRMGSPPVRETAMAIGFIPMTGFGVVQLVHLSDFWQQSARNCVPRCAGCCCVTATHPTNKKPPPCSCYAKPRC